MNIRRHWAIFPYAFTMAILIALPLILFPFMAGERYRGINIAHFGTDQHFYLSRGREVLDGNGLGNSILHEGKDGPDPFATWNERILVTPFHWLGLGERIDVSTLYTAMNAVGIFILVILIYALAYQLSGDKLLSAVIATFVIGGSSFVFYRAFFYEDMNLYGRAMTPYVSSIGLFLYLNLIVRSLVRPRPRTILAAAAAFGALFYIYLFAWTYVLTFNGILIALYLLRRDWEKVKTLAIVTLGGLLLGSYNLYRLIASLSAETGDGMSYFHFVEHSRAPLFSKVGAVLLVIFGAYWWKNRKDERIPILLAFILSGWVVLNQQLITGIRIQPGHYYWYFVVPLGIVIALFMTWSMLRRSWRLVFCIALLAAVYVNTIVGQYRSAVKSLSAKVDEQRFQPILGELQKDKEPSVVLASGNDNAFLYVMYTRHDVFWHDSATLYKADLERMKNSFFVFMLLNKDAKKDVVHFLQDAAEYKLSSEFYNNTYHAIEGFTSGYDYYEYGRRVRGNDPALLEHRQKTIEELSKEFSALMADPNSLKNLLARYQVEYVVWDDTKDPEWDMTVLPELHDVTSTEGLHLYRL